MTEQNNTPQHDRHVWPHHEGPITPAPKQKKPSPFKKPIVWLPIVAGVVAFAMGSGSASAQTVEVEKRVEVPVEKIVTKTVEKEVTPAACITALDLAQQGFTHSSESMGYMNDALQAAGKLNVAGIEQANRDMELLNPKIKALTEPMRVAVAECRAKQ